MQGATPDRDEAYLTLLRHGLVLLRNIACTDRIDLCRIESEHLHEIPTLVGEPNERRHAFYLQATRSVYLQSLRKLGATEYLESATIWYSGPWQVLASAANGPLSE